MMPRRSCETMRRLIATASGDGAQSAEARRVAARMMAACDASDRPVVGLALMCAIAGFWARCAYDSGAGAEAAEYAVRAHLDDVAALAAQMVREADGAQNDPEKQA